MNLSGRHGDPDPIPAPVGRERADSLGRAGSDEHRLEGAISSSGGRDVGRTESSGGRGVICGGYLTGGGPLMLNVGGPLMSADLACACVLAMRRSALRDLG